MENNIDWEDFERKIKTLKSPLLFLNILSKNINRENNKLSDDNLSVILRFMLRYNCNFFLKYDIRKFINLEKFESSKNIMNDFYHLIVSIKKLQDNNITLKKINKLSLIEKINKINSIRDIFLSQFDICYSSIPIQFKIGPILYNGVNKQFHKSNVIERLENIYKLLGISFFLKNNIKLITYYEFECLSDIEIVRYLAYLLKKISLFLDLIKKKYQNIEIIIDKIENILNPIPFELEINNISSEIDITDINIFS